jgi:hypothetical protein
MKRHNDCGRQECGGRSPLPGFGAALPGDAIAGPRKIPFTAFAAVGNETNRSAEDGVLCRGVGCPHKILFSLAAAGGMK